jgi:transposase
VDERQLIDGIRWRIRVGAPSRDVPPAYGSWLAACGIFRRWQRDGAWARILTTLQAVADAAGEIVWDVSVDSTVARAHQHAAGARKRDLQAEPPGGTSVEPADHALGRSRGRLTTKLHLGCEQGQKPLSIVVTAGQRGDNPQFIAVIEGIRVPRLGGGLPRTRADRVLVDRAYTSEGTRRYLRRRGIKVTIASKADKDVNPRELGSKGGRPPTAT